MGAGVGSTQGQQPTSDLWPWWRWSWWSWWWSCWWCEITRWRSFRFWMCGRRGEWSFNTKVRTLWEVGHLMMVVMAKHCILVCLCMCMEERGISRRLELCPSTKWPPSAPIGGLASNQVATNGIWGMRPSPLKSPRISHISCFFIASAPEARIFTQLFSTKPIFTQLFPTSPFSLSYFPPCPFSLSYILLSPIFTQPFSTQLIFNRLFTTGSIFTWLFWAFALVQTGDLY